MLAIVAAVIFAIAYLLNAFSVHTDVAFSTIALLLLGLACLALHQAGVGAGWHTPTTSRRRR